MGSEVSGVARWMQELCASPGSREMGYVTYSKVFFFPLTRTDSTFVHWVLPNALS